MAAFRPELFTVEEVINFYLQTEGSEYNVYAGTSPNEAYKRYHFEGEKELGLQELTAALMQISSKGENYNPYLIQIISPSKIKGKPASFTSISFQLNRPMQYMPMQQQNAIGGRAEILLEKLIESQNLLINRVSALELESEEEDEPQKDTLGRIMENPQVQGILMGLVDRFINGGGQPSAIAGINDTPEAVQVLEQLMAKGVTVEHLHKLNAMSEMKLKSLLLML